MAKRSYGQEWEWAAGLKSIRILYRSLPTVIALSAVLSSCQIFFPQSDSDTVDPSLPQEKATLKLAGLPHPAKATAWDTQVLLLSQQLPPSEDLISCRQDFEAIARDTDQSALLISARDSGRKIVEKQPKLFHWCFYIMTSQLEAQMGNPEGSLKEKGQTFLDRMKLLWILARSLDLHFHSDVYFIYLRKMYIQISSERFGRSLEVMGKSADQLNYTIPEAAPPLPPEEDTGLP